MSGYLSKITLRLVCQDDVSCEQRVLRLKSELTGFYGKPVQFYDVGRSTHAPEESDTRELWEIERAKPTVNRSSERIIIADLLRSALITGTYAIVPAFEQFLVRLAEEGVVDFAMYLADRQVSTLFFRQANRPIYLCLGRRANIYIFVKQLYVKTDIRKEHVAGRSYFEVVNLIAEHVENLVESIPVNEIRHFIKAIDDELRLKLGEAEFSNLISDIALFDLGSQFDVPSVPSQKNR